jgi:hypothetical protein
MASRRFVVVVSGAKICLAANPLRSDRRKRTKDSIAAVRHLYLDFDIDGEPALLRSGPPIQFPRRPQSSRHRSADIRSSGALTVSLSSSREAPSTCSRFPLACTDCNRTLRLPGFRNCKNDPSYPITVKYPCDSTSNPGDFRLDIPAANALPLPMQSHRERTPASTPIPNTIGGWIPHELAHGKDAAKRTRTIASRRSDNPVASARLCLNEGVPMEDVCHAAGGPPPLRDCLCVVYPKRSKQGSSGAACEEAYS